MFSLSISRYRRTDPLYRDIASAAREAEAIAAAVDTARLRGFRAVRHAVRNALATSGIGARIDTLVAQLLDSGS